MSFTINEEITTKLHYKDVASITVLVGIYTENYKEFADKEFLSRITNLVNRLGKELYNHSDNEKPNRH